MSERDDRGDGGIVVPLGLGTKLEEGVFVERPNQFTLVLEDDRGERFKAAMADRGRLLSLLVPGRTILVEPRSGGNRKTAFQALAAVDEGGGLVSLDTVLPNRLVAEALRRGVFEEVVGERVVGWRAEQTIGGSRFDFVVELEGERRAVVEVKSIGRIDEDGVARFPDAPTSRGARHVRELAELRRGEGERTRCVILFIVQGEGANAAEVDEGIDAGFGEAVRGAVEAGVEVIVRACPLTRAGIVWGEEIEWRGEGSRGSKREQGET